MPADKTATTPAKPAPNYRIEALAKGLRILSLFTRTRPTMRVKEIASVTGYPMPTVFRLVATLEGEGYLERTVDGSVRPSTAVLQLGFAAIHGLDLVQTSESTLQQLAESTRETVNLGVLFEDQVLIVARLQGAPTTLAATVRVGSTVPAVFSSMGKVLLSYISDEDLASRITDDSFSVDWGPNAVRSLHELRKQIKEVRTHGYIVQEEEAIPGLSSIAAPIRQEGGIVTAALNIAVASSRYSRERLLAELRVPLLDACQRISARLGT